MSGRHARPRGAPNRVDVEESMLQLPKRVRVHKLLLSLKNL